MYVHIHRVPNRHEIVVRTVSHPTATRNRTASLHLGLHVAWLPGLETTADAPLSKTGALTSRNNHTISGEVTQVSAHSTLLRKRRIIRFSTDGMNNSPLLIFER